MLPPDDMHPLWFQIGVDGWGALGVFISTTVLYFVYTLVMQLLGPLSIRSRGSHRILLLGTADRADGGQ